MIIHLHKNATTTPAQRAFIQNNPHLKVSELADLIGVSKTTVRRWRNRSDVFDQPHTPKRVNKALAQADEIKAVLTRLATRAGLDDLHRMLQSFWGIHCSRASLNRCLKRYHISKFPGLNLPCDLKDYTGVYVYYTCFHIPTCSVSSPVLYLHTLLDCTFRTFVGELCLSGPTFLSRHIREFPLKILGILHQDPVVLLPGSDHGDIIDRHGLMVESQCRRHGIAAHRLDPQPFRTVQTLRKNCLLLRRKGAGIPWNFPWSSRAEFAGCIHQYNARFTLGTLKHQTPRQALEAHYADFPNSFRQRPDTWA